MSCSVLWAWSSAREQAGVARLFCFPFHFFAYPYIWFPFGRLLAWLGVGEPGGTRSNWFTWASGQDFFDPGWRCTRECDLVIQIYPCPVCCMHACGFESSWRASGSVIVTRGGDNEDVNSTVSQSDELDKGGCRICNFVPLRSTQCSFSRSLSSYPSNLPLP